MTPSADAPAPDAALALIVRNAFADGPPERLGIAVSGGSDSMALLHLLDDWRADGGPGLEAVTLDHGLRPEAAAEAAMVADVCKGLGLGHTTLTWRWDGRGNLPDRARRARLRLIADWARARGLGTVALGHTADDQAETFLMRLARGSGLDGLSGMARTRRAEGIAWLRPVLSCSREDLRGHLRRRGVAWVEDPTNEDPAYDRVKARRVLAALAPLGIDAGAIGDTARRLAEARRALESYAVAAARAICRIEAGDVVLARQSLLDCPMETQMRLLGHAIAWVASAEYRPRHDALAEAHSAMIRQKRRTLGGCVLSPAKREIRVTREFRAVQDTVSAVDEIWDGRWRVSGPAKRGLTLRALGAAGLALCPDWRKTGLPRATLMASPAVWSGDDLVAAPQAGRGEEWRAELACGDDDYFSSLLSH